jgi:hypothetical protein
MSTQDLSGEQLAFLHSYEQTLAFLEARQASSPLSLIDLEGEFFHLTVYEGQDWSGRGLLKNAEIQGEISAYQVFMDQIKQSLNPSDASPPQDS